MLFFHIYFFFFFVSLYSNWVLSMGPKVNLPYKVVYLLFGVCYLKRKRKKNMHCINPLEASAGEAGKRRDGLSESERYWLNERNARGDKTMSESTLASMQLIIKWRRRMERWCHGIYCELYGASKQNRTGFRSLGQANKLFVSIWCWIFDFHILLAGEANRLRHGRKTFHSALFRHDRYVHGFMTV